MAIQGSVSPTSSLGNGASRPPVASVPNVLVIDDEWDAAREMAQCLSKAGLACEPVSDPWHALRLMAGKHQLKVAVIDIRMPELSGLELIERYCALGRPAGPEIVLVSGSAELDDAVSAMRLGVRRLLRKPLDLQDLVREVKTAAVECDLKINRPPSLRMTRRSEDPINIDMLIGMSRWRERFFAKDMQSDQCWRMLLELYKSRLLNRRVSLTSLAMVSGLPMATAVRKIHSMHEHELVEFTTDPHDKRRTFVALSGKGSEQMEMYLAKLATGETSN